MFFEKYPNTDFHELNLDWLIAKMKELQIQFDEFKVVNNITFSGQWDITKQYPAWTIVSDNNIGYVSQKPVPAGVVLTNTDYWVEVIDYTAQIAGLQTRVIALENTVGDANSGLVKDVNDLDTRVTNLEKVVYAKDLIILGDSYGVDATAGGYSWASYLQDNIHDRTIYRSTVGGTGFASDLYISDNWLSMLQTMAIPDNNTIKDIIILGGANDGNLYFDGTATISAIASRIDSFMTYCANTFPNAKVKLCFVGWFKQTIRYDAFNEVKAMYKKITNKYVNAAYYDNGESILHNSSLINNIDLVHPTQVGSDMLSEFAMSMLNDGNYEVSYKANVTVTKASNVTSISAIDRCTVIYDNDSATISLLGHNNGTYTNVAFTTPLPINTGMASDYIATLSDVPYGKGTTDEYKVLPCVVGITGVGAKNATVLISLSQNNMACRIYNIEGEQAGWTVSLLLLPPLTFKINTKLN